MQTVDVKVHSSKSAVPGIDRNDLHVIYVVVPTRPEQRTIVEYLDRETSKIDALIAKAQQAIELQKEHRTALISAAVTGKIDVRDLVTANQCEERAA
jgi:type I restriction enzyme S subunit